MASVHCGACLLHAGHCLLWCVSCRCEYSIRMTAAAYSFDTYSISTSLLGLCSEPHCLGCLAQQISHRSLYRHQNLLLAGGLVRPYAGPAFHTHDHFPINLLASMVDVLLMRITAFGGPTVCRLGGVQHHPAAGVDAPHLWRLAQTLHLPLHLPNQPDLCPLPAPNQQHPCAPPKPSQTPADPHPTRNSAAGVPSRSTSTPGRVCARNQ